MNLPGITQQIEITFWQLFVRLLKNRTTLYTSLSLVIICLGAIIVSLMHYSLDRLQNHKSEFQAAVPVVLGASEVEAIETDQWNVLVILVDQIQTNNPGLLGIWLANYQPVNSSLFLQPYFATEDREYSGVFSELSTSFRLQSNGIVSSKFLAVLVSNNLRWDYYIVLDSVALAELVELSGGSDLVKAGEQVAINQLNQFSATHQIQAMISDQIKLMEQLCEQDHGFIQIADPVYTIEKLTSHMRADFETGLIVKNWQNLKASGRGLSCQISTFAELSFVPPP